MSDHVITKREYAVKFSNAGSGWFDGYEFDSFAQAEEAFENECRDVDPGRRKYVRVVLQESDYNGEDRIEVRELNVIRTASIWRNHAL